jgi:hypothetical protein
MMKAPQVSRTNLEAGTFALQSPTSLTEPSCFNASA